MSEDTGRLFCRLVEIMSRLRSPEGCPWDREQTHQTLKKDLVEETYETVDAIDSGDMEELCGELGDLLLQIVFHAELACEKDDFCIDDVLKGINAKLIRRHPHVFADAAASCAEEVIDRWEKIKSGEKGFQGRTSVLDGVPKTLPALSQAMKISKKAARAGFEWPNIDALKGIFVKTKVQNGIHHTRHGEFCAGADGDQKRVICHSKLLAHVFLYIGKSG
jgi:tetrapyrrole methylase family protein/MazG family protein